LKEEDFVLTVLWPGRAGVRIMPGLGMLVIDAELKKSGGGALRSDQDLGETLRVEASVLIDYIRINLRVLLFC
jgi:hypothetical protein